MDGHFVPNLSLGAPVVASLRRVTRLSFEVHFMIHNPDVFLVEFAEAGADPFIGHSKGNLNLHRTIQSIRALGKRVACR
jgi:ribulose-phosphate 3-epimerase